MSLPIAIHKLTAELGLTSRTLRHWESEGLFQSFRDGTSGWRIYDETAVECIKITAILRKLDISLKDIKLILDHRTFDTLEAVFKKQLAIIEQDDLNLKKHQKVLMSLIDFIAITQDQSIGINSLKTLEDQVNTITKCQPDDQTMEEIIMPKIELSHPDVRFITLPPMRTVYHTAIGTAPEDEAMAPVISWLETRGLIGTARLLGGNVDPLPSPTRPEYGYGMCASIPEEIEIPDHLKEMRLPGGLYAMFSSSEDIYASWQVLMKYLTTHSEYTPDRSRLCFEEHLRNDHPDGVGNQFHLNLLEPVKKR